MAAADYERVDFVAPVMFDIINIEEQLKHHYKSLGGWTNVFQVDEKQIMIIKNHNLSKNMKFRITGFTT